MTDNPKARAMVFVDGQNLYRCVKDAFGYTYPNYDVMALARKVCEQAGSCFVCGVRFYTGFPDQKDEPRWNAFWSKKLLAITRQGVQVFSTPLKYRNEKIDLGDNVVIERRMGREKGVDVRIALDLVRGAIDNSYDVAIILSQDQDLAEAASDVKQIARKEKRTCRVISAYPWRPGYYPGMNDKGINGTDWLKIGRDAYDECIDQFDYRPKPK